MNDLLLVNISFIFIVFKDKKYTDEDGDSD